jgi:LPS sulfotransferase NodH
LTELAGRPEEYFRPDYLALYLRDWGGPVGASIDEYTRLCINATSSDNAVFTAKLHWYQMGWLIKQLRSSADRNVPPHELVARQFPAVRYIHLVRSNHARQALSWYRAIQTNQWFKIDASAPHVDEREPDYQQVRWLEDLIGEHTAAWAAYFNAAGVEPLRISFEEMVRDRDQTVCRVMDELGVCLPAAYRAPRGRMRQQSDGRTERWLADYLAVRDTLPRKDSRVRWSSALNRFTRPELRQAT